MTGDVNHDIIKLVEFCVKFATTQNYDACIKLGCIDVDNGVTN